MALRNIRYEEDEILRKISKPVKNISEKIRILAEDMIETMYENNGVGLAAPQVGILRRMIVLHIGEPDEKKACVLINPEILERSGCQIKEEGCLSIPGEKGYVERPTYVKVKALDIDGEEIIMEGHDSLAIALSHETDHLDGVLYVDKLVEVEEEVSEEVLN